MTYSLSKYLCLILILCSLFSCTKDEDTPTEDENPNDALVSSQILQLTNEYRASKNLVSLKINDVADQLALDHTLYMISKKVISHDGLNDRGKALVEKVKAMGYGENVASFYPDAQSVVDAWIKSDDHRKNLEGNFTHIGISSVKDENGKYYYTQLFYQ